MNSSSGQPESPAVFSGSAAGHRVGVVTRSVVLLVLALLAGGALIAWSGSRMHGAAGVTAGWVATGVCLLSGVAALVAVGVTAGTPGSLNGLLFSILLRTLLPLGAAVVLSEASTQLREAEIFKLFLWSYLLTLAVETLLSVRLVKSLSNDS